MIYVAMREILKFSESEESESMITISITKGNFSAALMDPMTNRFFMNHRSRL